MNYKISQSALSFALMICYTYADSLDFFAPGNSRI